MQIKSRIALAGAGMVFISLTIASSLIYWVVTTEDVSGNFEKTTRTLFLSLLALILIGTALSLFLSFYLSHKALAPVQELIQQVETADGSTRIEANNSGDDVGKIALSLNDLLARIDESSINQRRFTADAGHELRGPLTTIQLSIDTLRSRGDSLELQDISMEVGRLAKLCNDLLDLSRVENSSIITSRVSLSDVIDEQIKTFGDRFMPIQVRVLESAHCYIECNRQLLGMAVRNLLENAVESASTRVEISVACDDIEAHVVVRDDGPGVPADLREKIFERFYRIQNVRTNGMGGTGLGLSVVSAVMKAHGGKAFCIGSESGGEFHLIFEKSSYLECQD